VLVRTSHQMNMKLGGSVLQQDEDFVYLGGTISADCSRDKDVMRQIGLADRSVKKLQKIWSADDISKKTKVCLYQYQSLVQSLLLYNSETWTSKKEHKWKLNKGFLNISLEEDHRG